MLFVRSAAKLYTLLLVFLLPIQLVLYIQFGTIKIGCRQIILGSGFGNSETDMLHSYLHSTVSQHITLQGIIGSRNLSSLTDPEISHLHKYLLPDWGHTGVVVGDVSVCNIKYAEYLLKRCNNARVIIVSDGWEKDFHSMRKWMLSLNEDPWSVNNTSSHPICFPQLNSQDTDSLSFNNLVRRLYKNYRKILEKLKVNYKSQVSEITTDVLLNAPHNVTKLLGMKQKGPTTWVYRGSGRHSNADRTAAVLHAPHGTPHRLTSLTRLVRQSASLLQPEGNCPDDLLFVFVDNLDSMPLLKRSLVKKGCRFVHLGQKLIGWTWAFKIEAVLWFLQRSKVTNDTYIISSDAGDSALIGDPSDLIEKFRSYNADLLLATRPYEWPLGTEQETTFEHNIYSNISRCNMHPCAGGWMAKKESAQKYLLKMVESYYRSPRRWDDALEWRRLHFHYYPRIQADVYERIFARTDMAATCLTIHV